MALLALLALAGMVALGLWGDRGRLVEQATEWHTCTADRYRALLALRQFLPEWRLRPTAAQRLIEISSVFVSWGYSSI
jgi:hypothetical protein